MCGRANFCFILRYADDLTIFNSQQLVANFESAQPVSNHQGGPALHELLQGLHDAGLGPGVHRTGGLVKDQNGSVPQVSPGQGNAPAHPLR